jgi:hypothetical protein
MNNGNNNNIVHRIPTNLEGRRGGLAPRLHLALGAGIMNPEVVDHYNGIVAELQARMDAEAAARARGVAVIEDEDDAPGPRLYIIED